MTEEMMKWYTLSFVSTGCFAGILAYYSYLVSLSCEALVLFWADVAWTLFGYSRTGDWPSGVWQALGETMLLLPATVVYGVIPNGLAFGITVTLVSVLRGRRRAERRSAT